MSSTSWVSTAVERGVAVLTVDRPPANALDRQLVGQLTAAAASAASRNDVGALVIIGTGRCFVAGADITMLRTLDPTGFAGYLSEIQRAFDDVEAVPIPVIAAINGHAMGGGLELALACDLRFAAAGVRLGLPEVKLGLLPGAGGTQRLVEALGRGRALELLFTGRPLEAEEALAVDLVNRVVSPDRLRAEAVEFAAGLASGPRDAIRAIKACVLARLDGGRRAGLRAEAAGVRHLFGTPDAREGLAAFVEKRAARFGATR